MRSVKLYRYTLPMDSGVVLRNNKLTHRVGYVVELSEQGRVGYGEIAPLPGFSPESVEEAGALAKEMMGDWVEYRCFNYEHAFASVACGLSMAEMELTQQLPQRGNYNTAPLCKGDPDALWPILGNMVGEKIAKVKVGRHEPIRDGMMVSLLLESIPNLKLRLDANRAWSREQADKFISYLPQSMRHRIVFIEEPCHKPSDSLSFSLDSGVFIAWDETLQDAAQQPNFRVADLTGGRALIIKPMVLGSLGYCQNLIEQANAMNMQVVVSSSIESSLGLTQLARWAALVAPTATPGLDTVDLFQEQLITPWPECSLPVKGIEELELLWEQIALK
ncbi:o-succinylbenzoate synthase [Vibrio palustris]|uniref:o-succinylbenzoate synthase n=1 Tax=Vibrio palustris TaxID=1918946 RepID=A0A1R4B3E1_9VIBR|nr:o-succinylbenzoate synthase [Vibrio palustris]SJL83434.1 o-succinylbenzoate synthase [Vibrio palustris]